MTPIADSVIQSVSPPTRHSGLNQPFIQSVRPSVSRSVGLLVCRSVRPSLGRLDSQSIGRSVCQPASQSVDGLVSRLVGQSVIWSVSQSVSWSVGQSVRQWVKLSVSQPVTELVNNSSKKSLLQLVTLTFNNDRYGFACFTKCIHSLTRVIPLVTTFS